MAGSFWAPSRLTDSRADRMGTLDEVITSVKGNLLPAITWTLLLPVLAVAITAGGVLAWAGLSGSLMGAEAPPEPKIALTDQASSLMDSLACVAIECPGVRNSRSYLLTALAPDLTITDTTGIVRTFDPASLDTQGWAALHAALSAAGNATGDDIETTGVETSASSLTFHADGATSTVEGALHFSPGRAPVLLDAVITAANR